MDFVYTDLRQDILVDKVVTIHYFEYTSDFFYPGEQHDFWECLYVDKGEVEVTAGTEVHVLKKGDIIFHKPMEFHNLWANGTSAPNLIVVSFTSSSPAMSFFENKILRVGDAERILLARIISEANSVFSSDLSDPNMKMLERNAETPFGGEQLIKLSLELMLIQLVRKQDAPSMEVKLTTSIKEKSDHDVVQRIIQYLEENINQNLALSDICRDNLIGRSYLQKIFREKIGCGVIDHFGRMKIDAAKQMIRKGTSNFTQIAHDLGFASIHYFSRRFKKVSGMTPTEYASSVKSISDGAKNPH